MNPERLRGTQADSSLYKPHFLHPSTKVRLAYRTPVCWCEANGMLSLSLVIWAKGREVTDMVKDLDSVFSVKHAMEQTAGLQNHGR